MTALYTADEVRAAEEPLLAAMPDGALMQRAATGLAPSACGCSAAATATRSRCWSAAATTAATRCSPAPRSPAAAPGSTAVLLDPDRAHAGRAGRAAGPAAGSASATPAAARSGAPTSCSTGCSASAAAAGCDPTPPSSPRPPRTAPALTVAVDVPSGVDADTGAVDGRGVPGRCTRDVRRGQARVGRGRRARATRRGPPRRHRPRADLPAATAFRLTEADVAARLLPPPASDDKYSQGVVGVVAGSAAYAGAGVLCTGAALRTRPGLVRYAGTAAEASGRPGRRRSSPTGGPSDAGACRRGWSGRAWAPTTTPAACWPRCWPRTCR